MNPAIHSAVKPSTNILPHSEEVLNGTIRQFAKGEIVIFKQSVLGQGVFAKCFFGTVGPNRACIKILRHTCIGKSNEYFIREANILSLCCHPNVSFMFGICQQAIHKMLILSFHGIDSRSCSLHSVLLSKNRITLDISSIQWKRIVLGIIYGMNYIHDKSIIHNDIKEDNVLLDIDHDGQLKAALIDFGKACRDGFGKKYTLSSEEIKEYKSKHPHIAPDLRDGFCSQDKLSDVFSFGRLVSIISKEVLPIPALCSLMSECMKVDAVERPNTKDLHTFLKNLLDVS